MPFNAVNSLVQEIGQANKYNSTLHTVRTLPSVSEKKKATFIYIISTAEVDQLSPASTADLL